MRFIISYLNISYSQEQRLSSWIDNIIKKAKVVTCVQHKPGEIAVVIDEVTADEMFRIN